MTDVDDIDPVEFAGDCEEMATGLVRTHDYDEHTRAILRTGVPDLASIIREQAAEIEQLRSQRDDLAETLRACVSDSDLAD